MKVHLRYFASIREALGQGSETVDTVAATLGALPAIIAGPVEPVATEGAL